MVEIRRRGYRKCANRWKTQWPGEKSVAFSQQHDHTAITIALIVGAFVGDREVGFAVAVEISEYPEKGKDAFSLKTGQKVKLTVTCAQQHGCKSGGIVHYPQVWLAVSI